jgi:hypothetical protein
MAATSPGKDYGASFFENSSEKRKYFLKSLYSDRGATRGILLVESCAGNYYNYTSGAGDGELDPRQVRHQIGSQLGKALVRGILGSMRR